MIKQNFTQYAIANGYPSDYDILDHGDLGSSGYVSKRQRGVAQARHSERLLFNRIAHLRYTEDILTGKVIDPSGEITRENILTYRQGLADKATESKRQGLKSNIAWIEGLGRMSHKENGTLKLSYQRTIDLYQTELADL